MRTDGNLVIQTEINTTRQSNYVGKLKKKKNLPFEILKISLKEN